MHIAIPILLTYSIAIVVAGHGAAPIGILLVYSLIAIGMAHSWDISEITAGIIIFIAGWAGIIGLVSATLLLRSNPSKQLTYQFLFCVILYLSWFGFAIGGTVGNDSGSLWSSFILSTPFHIAFLFVAYQFFTQHRKTYEG